MTETRLPSAFAELEPYAEKWCLATEAERWNMRMTTPMVVMREFYDAFPLDAVPEDALNLLHLVYSMIMVSMAIEVFGQQKPTDSADAVIDRVGEPVP